MMKKILLAVGIVLGAMALSGCDRVEPGYVGIKVNKLGDDKGVGDVVGVGRVWTGINTDLYVFPMFKQMKSYDEPFVFQMRDGTTIGYKIGVSYKVDPTKVTTVFQTYRKGVDDITDSDLRQKISDSLTRLGSKMSTDQFIDGGKAQLLDDALNDIQVEMGPVGIQILSLSWMGKPDYPASVNDSINTKVNANQKTLQRQQEVLQKNAEADMARSEAKGQADSRLLLADSEAKSITIRGQALRANPEVLQLEAINRWNGVLPQYMASGAQTPLVTIPAGK